MLIELFELACNHALVHDQDTVARLKKLQGKSMALRIKTINQSITLTPHPEGVELSREVPESVDVILTTSLSAILKISRAGMEDAELKPGELEISGDPIVGQRFATIIAELDINWEGLLAEQLGDSTARVVSIAAGQAKEFAEQSKQQLNHRFVYFVREELGLTAKPEEVESFLDGVDTLRADVERLANRLKRLREESSG